MKLQKIFQACFTWMFFFSCLIINGCSTGIENTKTIKMTKSEKKLSKESQEEIFLKDLIPDNLNKWELGKKFIVSDQRASLIFESAVNGVIPVLNEGDTIFYFGVKNKLTPAGSDELIIVFSKGQQLFNLPTGKSPDVAYKSLSSMDFPMLIDLNLVDEYRTKLQGKRLWTRSQLWYDDNGNKITGLKFVPVVIDGVTPGNMIFPLKISISDEENNSAVLFMNIRNTGIESRNFANLFYLSDPKSRYPNILPEVWSIIQQGKLAVGMTKDECKISIGNPSDVNAGHDWNSTIEIWQYSDGTLLQFENGLLVNFK